MEKKPATGGFWMIVEELPKDETTNQEIEKKNASNDDADSYNFYPDYAI